MWAVFVVCFDVSNSVAVQRLGWGCPKKAALYHLPSRTLYRSKNRQAKSLVLLQKVALIVALEPQPLRGVWTWSRLPTWLFALKILGLSIMPGSNIDGRTFTSRNVIFYGSSCSEVGANSPFLGRDPRSFGPHLSLCSTHNIQNLCKFW